MTERMDRIVFWPLLLMASVALLIFAVSTVPDANVTWDEAGQFWMSQGAGYGTAWNAPDQGLAAGLDYGRAGNILDPIGFTSLLAGWVVLFGPEPPVLRALPFLFFLGTLVSSFYLGRALMRLPRSVALVLPLSVLTTYISSQWATEIRNYSMEMMGMIVATIAIIRYLQRPTWPRIVGLVAVLALFSVGSRYSYALAAAAAVVTVWLVLWRSHRLHQTFGQWVFALAAMAVAANFLIWNVGLLRGDRVWATYVDNTIRVESISDFTSARMLLQINFVYGWHKLTALFILLGLVSWWLMRRSEQSGSQLGLSLRSASMVWLPTWVFVVLYEIFRAAASQAGGPQWNAEHKHGIALVGVSIVSGFGSAVIVKAIALPWWRHRAATSGGGASAISLLVGQVSLWCAVFTLTWMSFSHFTQFERDKIETLAETVPTRVATAVAGENDVRWRVETLLYPSLRYLVFKSGVELGDLTIDEAEPFSTYGHDLTKFRAALTEATLCDPSVTTAVLAAGSSEENAQVFADYSREISALGCSTEIVPLSNSESLLLVRGSSS